MSCLCYFLLSSQKSNLPKTSSWGTGISFKQSRHNANINSIKIKKGIHCSTQQYQYNVSCKITKKVLTKYYKYLKNCSKTEKENMAGEKKCTYPISPHFFLSLSPFLHNLVSRFVSVLAILPPSC